MKKLIILFFLFNSYLVFAQNIEAKYKVTQNVSANINGELKHLASLESSGYFYKKGNKYIYFEKPDYLKDYPNGVIKVQTGASSNSFYELFADSVLSLNYKDLDSMHRYYRNQASGKGNIDFNYKQPFDIDYYEWKVVPETKVINGITCQKATFTVRTTLLWVVWFAPSIPTQAGIVNMIGVPGLVFEAENVNQKINYTLESYKIGVDIPEKVFHPAEFSQRFVLRPKSVKSNVEPEKSRIMKQAELTNQ